MKHANGTELRQTFPWGLFVGGRALCSDGKVRALSRISIVADSFFSIPAAVRVGGKTVSGFVTVETVEGLSTPSASDPLVVKFVAVKGRRNSGLLS